ncbi:MAG: FHA domain-containing protein [Myxococcales bacterium]|nr:FHA domain-containing protein [Myxococcales bacterium]
MSTHPHPFLVHASGALTRLDPSRRDELTTDRLMVEKPRAALQDAMLVAPVVARDIDAGRVTIGVATACDIVLDDASVSKRHAYFTENNGIWLLTDADSSAGTLINNQPLSPNAARELASGDRIALGYVELTFLLPEGFHELVHGLFGAA